ncbi:tyrosine-protein phosphatase non-receptor type substrate 1-like isoform X4 [Ranitomeya imitator]|uniref:tyrosine-protein phosphatase non-receptor type substrate 1-like isoform X4 n=1 Tax=Ranitomeya imitator TaxID=111125 RepID=UPI0037E7854A
MSLVTRLEVFHYLMNVETDTRYVRMKLHSVIFLPLLLWSNNKMTAHPIVKIVTKPVIKDEENALCCSITGFYPPDITITWLWGAEVLDTHEMSKPQRQEDGTYNVSSAVVIIPTDDSMNKTWTCRVTHASLQFPVETTFQLILTERADVRSSEGSADWSYTTFTGLFIAIPVVFLLLVVLLTGWIWKNRESSEFTPLRPSPESPESTLSSPSFTKSKSEPSRPPPPDFPVSPLVETFVVLQEPSKSTTLKSRVSSSLQHSSRELGPPAQVKCQDGVQQGFLQPRLYLSGHEHSAKTYHWGHPFGD